MDLNYRRSVDLREIAGGLVVDLDADGNIVGIDVALASKKLDLGPLESVSLPGIATKITWRRRGYTAGVTHRRDRPYGPVSATRQVDWGCGSSAGGLGWG